MRGLKNCIGFVVACCMLAYVTAYVHAMSSANYDIPVHVLDGAGEISTGGVYSVLTATAQAGGIGTASSTNYTVGYGFMAQQLEALPPSIPEVDVTPDPTPSDPTTTDDLLCTVTTETTVAPGLTAQYEYVWSNGIDTVMHGPKEDLTDTLSSAFTLKNQTWECTVRGYDGYSYSQEASDSTTTVNTLPGPCILSFPTVLGTASNLVCTITDKSPDPDGDVWFTFDWYVDSGGGFVQFFGAVDDLVDYNWSQVNNVDTSPDDEWYCVVTPRDDEVVGTPIPTATCTITTHGTETSYISLGFDGPNVVTLGETITVTGSITPPPISGAIVSFESTSPSGVVDPTVPEAVAIGGSTYSRTFYPTEASEGRDPWSLESSWPGDDTYMPATSDPVTFTVNKAQPTLSLELSHSSAALGFDQLTAWATMTAPIPDSLDGLLSGRLIKLWMKKPDATAAGPVEVTTDGDGVATFAPADFASAGIVFDMAGTWQFIAQFEGDDNFLPATSADYDEPESVRLTIKDRAGYAVIVVGKLDDAAEGHPEHAKTADYVYRVFRDRGFAEEDIYYLREGPSDPAPDIHVDDTSPTQSDVQTAIESWALGEMNSAAAPLYVVFLDHGGGGEDPAFYLYSGSYDETRVITPTELDSYLDTLQDNLNPSAQDEDIVLVYGACYSGSYISTVSGEHRLIMTSTSPDEVSHRGVTDPDDGIRDGEAFATELFRYAQAGKTLKESFELASEKIADYTATASNAGTAEQLQHPLLDGNGDGSGTVGEALSYEPGEDGGRAHELVLGYGVNDPDSVGWITVKQTVPLSCLANLRRTRPPTAHG